jgi:hypothetical protein
MKLLQLFGNEPSMFCPEEVSILKVAYNCTLDRMNRQASVACEDAERLAQTLLHIAQTHVFSGGRLSEPNDALIVSKLTVQSLGTGTTPDT